MFKRLLDLRTDGFRPSDLARRARGRVRDAREESVERLWNLQADTLEQIEDVLHRAPENLPVLSRVADAAERLVARRLETVTALPVENYEQLNAKEVRASVRELGHVDLLKVRRYETNNKNRKSVLGDIDKEIERRFRAEHVEPTVAPPPEGASPA
jgi:hypothetical protein